ncbi:response regulator [Gemmobacter serpentinus]|uniref:response regulator n=1 Tax=Gemmobacter serpentinus TaxID=2652247 RepID=UPI00124F43B1|nr:response regulator [Gemmobacter serpentinus]
MQRKVLLAEDDEISQQIYASLLQEAVGVDLTVVGDGRAALEEVLTNPFDLLILDQNLPVVTGDRIVRHLRASRTRNSETPILRLSAAISAPGSRTSAFGLETLLPKPISGEVFVATVRKLLGGAVPPMAPGA